MYEQPHPRWTADRFPRKRPHITAPHARCGRVILMPEDRLMPSDEGCAAHWSLLTHYLEWMRPGNPAPGKYKPMDHKEPVMRIA